MQCTVCCPLPIGYCSKSKATEMTFHSVVLGVQTQKYDVSLGEIRGAPLQLMADKMAAIVVLFTGIWIILLLAINSCNCGCQHTKLFYQKKASKNIIFCVCTLRSNPSSLCGLFISKSNPIIYLIY